MSNESRFFRGPGRVRYPFVVENRTTEFVTARAREPNLLHVLFSNHTANLAYQFNSHYQATFYSSGLHHHLEATQATLLEVQSEYSQVAHSRRSPTCHPIPQGP